MTQKPKVYSVEVANIGRQSCNRKVDFVTTNLPLSLPAKFYSNFGIMAAMATESGHTDATICSRLSSTTLVINNVNQLAGLTIAFGFTGLNDLSEHQLLPDGVYAKQVSPVLARTSSKPHASCYTD